MKFMRTNICLKVLKNPVCILSLVFENETLFFFFTWSLGSERSRRSFGCFGRTSWCKHQRSCSFEVKLVGFDGSVMEVLDHVLQILKMPWSTPMISLTMILLLLFKLIPIALNHWKVLSMILIIFLLAPVLLNSMFVVVPSDTLTIMVTVSPVMKRLPVTGSTNLMKDIKSMSTITPLITLHMKQTSPIIISKKPTKLQVRNPTTFQNWISSRISGQISFQLDLGFGMLPISHTLKSLTGENSLMKDSDVNFKNFSTMETAWMPKIVLLSVKHKIKWAISMLQVVSVMKTDVSVSKQEELARYDF